MLPTGVSIALFHVILKLTHRWEALTWLLNIFLVGWRAWEETANTEQEENTRVKGSGSQGALQKEHAGRQRSPKTMNLGITRFEGQGERDFVA